ncbi:MAG: S8 family serine peptidase [Chloroflexota bacterium]|nr:S8 family serine peptidase [Chloroflexota bacterium]
MTTRPGRWAGVALAAALAGVVFAAGGVRDGGVHAQQPPLPTPAVTTLPQTTPTGGPAVLAGTFDGGSLRKTSKIDPVLDELYRVDLLSRATANRPVTAANASGIGPAIAGRIATKQLRIDASGRVQVWVDTAGAPASALADLVGLGMQVQRTDDKNRIVQGLLPVSQLDAAAALASVATVRLPAYGYVQTGSVTTQGDSILGSATLRSQLTASGAGVRVGVISDGMEGLASAQASGDLGPVDTTTCNVAPGTPSPTASGAGAEGTAMSEIVQDIVPNAQIIFGYFGSNVGGTALDFNNAVNCLAVHADVVVDDISWFNTGPYNGTSLVSANTSAALNNPANPIRGYYTSAGNYAQNHYHAPWVDSGFYVGSLAGDWWELQRFQGGGGTTDGGYGLQCAAGVFCGDTVQLAPGGSLAVYLQWNDPFGGSTNDYDLLLQDNYTNPGTLYLASASRQGPGFPYPVEGFGITNTHGVTTTYNILIGNYKGLAAPRTFDMYVLCGGCAGFPTGLPAPDNLAAHNYNTLAGSLPNESDASGGVLAAGAISAANSPGYNTIDYYSSRGPTVDGRTKPDITGIDCVAITGAAGFPKPFCGTSAAAPHIAGIAALLLSCNPMLLQAHDAGAYLASRTTLRTVLLNGATPLGIGQPNNTFGYGRANTMTSAPLAGCLDTDGDGYPNGLEISMGKNPNVSCAIMRADVNGDGKVNIFDLANIAQYYGQSIPPAPPRLNQNGDATLNIFDLALTAQQYGKSVAACP